MNMIINKKFKYILLFLGILFLSVSIKFFYTQDERKIIVNNIMQNPGIYIDSLEKYYYFKRTEIDNIQSKNRFKKRFGKFASGYKFVEIYDHQDGIRSHLIVENLEHNSKLQFYFYKESNHWKLREIIMLGDYIQE